jgi:hypothetical protein
VDAVGELAQLVDRLRELALGRLQEPGGPRRIGSHLVAGQPQVDQQRRQPLLRAVVEVVLDPPALGVGGLDEPGA